VTAVASARGARHQGRAGCFRFTKKFNASHTTKPRGRTEEPADFQEAEDRYRDREGDAPLPPSTPQTNTTTAIDAGFHRHQSHLFGPELLQQPAIPPGERSSDNIETTQLTLQWKFNQAMVLNNVYFAPRVGEVSRQNLSNTNNEQLAAFDLELPLPSI
jgi:hypothetical protein